MAGLDKKKAEFEKEAAAAVAGVAAKQAGEVLNSLDQKAVAEEAQKALLKKAEGALGSVDQQQVVQQAGALLGTAAEKLSHAPGVERFVDYEKGEIAETAGYAANVFERLHSLDDAHLQLQMRWGLVLTCQYAFVKLFYIVGFHSIYGWIAFAAIFPLINAYYSKNRRTIMIITGILALMFAVLSTLNILNVLGHIFKPKDSIVLTTLTLGATFVHSFTCYNAYHADSGETVPLLLKGGSGPSLV